MISAGNRNCANCIGTLAVWQPCELLYTCYSHFLFLYRVGQKSKLLILSEYVNKTEKIGGA